jgi:hypothetical protein
MARWIYQKQNFMRNQAAIKTFRFEMDLACGGYPGVPQAKPKFGAD